MKKIGLIFLMILGLSIIYGCKELFDSPEPIRSNTQCEPISFSFDFDKTDDAFGDDTPILRLENISQSELSKPNFKNKVYSSKIIINNKAGFPLKLNKVESTDIFWIERQPEVCPTNDLNCATYKNLNETIASGEIKELSLNLIATDITYSLERSKHYNFKLKIYSNICSIKEIDNKIFLTN